MARISDPALVAAMVAIPGVIIAVAGLIRGYSISLHVWKTHEKRKEDDYDSGAGT